MKVLIKTSDTSKFYVCCCVLYVQFLQLFSFLFFICRNLFPENIIQACFENIKTVYVPKEPELIPYMGDDVSNMTTAAMTTMASDEPPEMVKVLQYQSGMNVLGTQKAI